MLFRNLPAIFAPRAGCSLVSCQLFACRQGSQALSCLGIRPACLLGSNLAHDLGQLCGRCQLLACLLGWLAFSSHGTVPTCRLVSKQARDRCLLLLAALVGWLAFSCPGTRQLCLLVSSQARGWARLHCWCLLHACLLGWQAPALRATAHSLPGPDAGHLSGMTTIWNSPPASMLAYNEREDKCWKYGSTEAHNFRTSVLTASSFFLGRFRSKALHCCINSGIFMADSFACCLSRNDASSMAMVADVWHESQVTWGAKQLHELPVLSVGLLC